LDILQEIEAALQIECAPVSWPIGMGKTFRGVFDLLTNQLVRFSAGEERRGGDEELIKGLDNPRLDELFPDETEILREEVELLRAASAPFDTELFLAGMQTPVFFGSGINNFGVREVLQSLIDWAPMPQSRAAAEREVGPAEAPMTGFVFKIQANMDPRHRDRIAFFRVCSGRYTPGKKLAHLRLGRDIRIPNAQTFLANSRKASENAVAGDIIGIHNHGQLQIGDTLTEGESLNYRGIPHFAPELFVSARPADPLKAKQLQKGLKELGEEGAVQVFTNALGRKLLGAVGQLQFEIVAHRLKGEYNVDALYEPAAIHTARWLSFPDDATRKHFLQREAASVAEDVDSNPVYLAPSRYKLDITRERFPEVGFHTTREHGEVLEQG
jgi:peptide chain release factor 3